jgi:hypothetical protein
VYLKGDIRYQHIFSRRYCWLLLALIAVSLNGDLVIDNAEFDCDAQRSLKCIIHLDRRRLTVTIASLLSSVDGFFLVFGCVPVDFQVSLFSFNIQGLVHVRNNPAVGAALTR